MCGPAMILGALGTAVSAAGTMASASAQAAQAEQQADLYDRQSEIEGIRASFQRSRTIGNIERAVGQTRAAAAERGLNVSGSVIDSTDNVMREGAMDLEAIRFGSEAEQGNLRFQAAQSRANAKSARTAGMIGAFGNVVSGASKMYTTLNNPYAVK